MVSVEQWIILDKNVDNVLVLFWNIPTSYNFKLIPFIVSFKKHSKLKKISFVAFTDRQSTSERHWKLYTVKVQIKQFL